MTTFFQPIKLRTSERWNVHPEIKMRVDYQTTIGATL